LEEQIDELFEENEYTFVEEKSVEIRKKADGFLAQLDNWLK
jgi:hypothetical protein